MGAEVEIVYNVLNFVRNYIIYIVFSSEFVSLRKKNSSPLLLLLVNRRNSLILSVTVASTFTFHVTACFSQPPGTFQLHPTLHLIEYSRFFRRRALNRWYNAIKCKVHICDFKTTQVYWTNSL